MPEVTISVPGIHCEGCVDTIRATVGHLGGVANIDGDPERRTVTVDYDPKLASLEEIERVLADTGFPTQGVIDEANEKQRDSIDPESSRPLMWVLVALGLASALALAGYVFGFKGFIYEVEIPNAFGRLGLLAVGVIAGTAAFFSPCVFPLLPGYVSYYLVESSHGEGDNDRSRRFRRSLQCGGAAAAGILLVNLAIGAIIAALGATSPFVPDPREDPVTILAIRFLAGLFIAVMGLRILFGRPGLPMRISTPRVRERSSGESGLFGFFLYGVMYNASGLGCTGPILLGIMLHYALLSEQSLAVFVVFSVTMGVLMVAVTALVGLAQHGLLRRLRHATHVLQRAGAVMLVTLGTYTMLIQSFGGGREFFVRVFLRHLL